MIFDETSRVSGNSLDTCQKFVEFILKNEKDPFITEEAREWHLSESSDLLQPSNINYVEQNDESLTDVERLVNEETM